MHVLIRGLVIACSLIAHVSCQWHSQGYLLTHPSTSLPCMHVRTHMHIHGQPLTLCLSVVFCMCPLESQILGSSCSTTFASVHVCTCPSQWCQKLKSHRLRLLLAFSQVILIKSKLVEALGDKANEIDIHSIDGFQVRATSHEFEQARGQGVVHVCCLPFILLWTHMPYANTLKLAIVLCLLTG